MSSSHKSRGAIGWLRIFLGIALVAILALIIISIAMGRGAKRRQMAQWRELGFPASMKEWQMAYDARKPADNRASTLRDAAMAINANKSADLPGYQLKAPRGAAFEDVTWENIHTHLEANKEARSLLDEALESPTFLFPLDFSQGFNLLLPHISEVRNIVRLLIVEALHHAHEDQMDGAAKSLRDAMIISHALDNEDLLISHLVRIAIDIQIIETLERVLSLSSLPDSTLKAFQDHWASRYDPNSLARSLAMEAGFASEYFDGGFPALLQGQNPAAPPNRGAALGAHSANVLLKASGLQRSDEAFYHRTLLAWVKAAQLTGKERVDAALVVDAETSRMLTRSGIQRLQYLMSSMLLPALSKALLKDHRYLAMLRTAEVGCAVERYRLAHDGQLPRNLEALVPEFLSIIPEDPWDEAPLRYRPLDDGKSYIVYSVGEDQVDNGGLPPDPFTGPRRSPPDDIFWVQRPLIPRPEPSGE